jgi:hypothetical protein
VKDVSGNVLKTIEARAYRNIISELTKFSTRRRYTVMPTWTTNRLVHTNVKQKVRVMRVS